MLKTKPESINDEFFSVDIDLIKSAFDADAEKLVLSIFDVRKHSAQITTRSKRIVKSTKDSAFIY